MLFLPYFILTIVVKRVKSPRWLRSKNVVTKLASDIFTWQNENNSITKKSSIPISESSQDKVSVQNWPCHTFCSWADSVFLCIGGLSSDIMSLVNTLQYSHISAACLTITFFKFCHEDGSVYELCICSDITQDFQDVLFLNSKSFNCWCHKENQISCCFPPNHQQDAVFVSKWTVQQRPWKHIFSKKIVMLLIYRQQHDFLHSSLEPNIQFLNLI